MCGPGLAHFGIYDDIMTWQCFPITHDCDGVDGIRIRIKSASTVIHLFLNYANCKSDSYIYRSVVLPIKHNLIHWLLW